MHVADGIALLNAALVAPWTLAVSAVDARHRRIPVRLQLAGAAVSLVAVAASVIVHPPGFDVAARAAAGAVILAALYAGLRFNAPGHLGGGDVRIAPAVGALGGLGGASGIALVSIGPFAVTAMVGLVLAHRGVRHVPHGPSMVCCGLLAAMQAT